MNKESLLKAREIIVKGLDQSKIDKQDKAELIMNLYFILEAENYNHNIDVLRRYSKPIQKKRGKRK